MRYTYMETNYPPEELFSTAYSRFYDSLKRTYLLQVEKATDKTYARDYFIRNLFAENEMTPRYSVFYNALISTFTHYKKIGETDALQLTLSSISKIREMTVAVIEQTLIIHTSLVESLEQLHWLYVEATEDHNASILDLIDTEQRLLKCSDQKIVLLLALDQATTNLNEEFSMKQEDSEPIYSFEEEQEHHETKLTRSQQVLIAYYISQLISTKHKKNVSKCADALHLFLGIPYAQITHSELYKKLLHPLTFSSKKATLQNLLVARSFFEKIASTSAIAMIDSDIEKVKKELE